MDFDAHARWIIPVTQPPIQNGFISVRNGLIQEISRSPTGSRQLDLGNVCILPGLVNAHTHLEFSHLQSPLGQDQADPGIEFTEWIRQVIQYRRAHPDREFVDSAIKKGIAESRAAGVVAIGEISTAPYLTDHYQRTDIEIVPFFEMLGRDRTQIQGSIERLGEAMATSRVNAGVSPHAPYSVHPELFSKLVQFAVSGGYPVAIHLAETLAELDLMRSAQSGSSRFAELFRELGLWFPESYPADDRPLNWLRGLQPVQRALIVHGNYLGDAEMDFLAEHREQMYVVFCPRTHAFFRHSSYPLGELIDRKIVVSVGTDSRASNPDLNLLGELRKIADDFPNLDPNSVLAMGSINGARALGIEKRYGSLEPGKSGNIAIVRSSGLLKGPFDWLTDSGSQCLPIADQLAALS